MSNIPIQEFIYFFSRASKASLECMKVLQSNQIPAQPICLDTAADREKAKNGKYFSIVSVPTLVVIFADGNLQLLVGKPKITAWIQQLINSMRESQIQNENPREDFNDQPNRSRKKHTSTSTQGLYGPISGNEGDASSEDSRKSRKNKKSSKKSRRKKDRGKKSGGRSSSRSSRSPSSSVSASRPRKSSNRKNKSEPVNFEEESEEENSSEIVFINDEQDEPPNTGRRTAQNTGGGKPQQGQPSRMNNLMEMAKKMQRDRKDTLGYDEKELPKNY